MNLKVLDLKHRWASRSSPLEVYDGPTDDHRLHRVVVEARLHTTSKATLDAASQGK